MIARPRFRFATWLSAAMLVVGPLVACSSSEESASASPEAKFCDALTGAYSKCSGASAECSGPVGADCTKLVGLISASALEAATKCLQSASCDSDPLSCIGKSLGEAKQSEAQKKLATAYCESCSAVGGGACTTAFFGTAQTPGLALALLPFGDAIIAEIEESCTSNPLGKTACQAAFTSCLTATTTKFLATSISADSATCLIDGVKSGITGGGGSGVDGGAGECAGCEGCCQDGVCKKGDDAEACGTGGGACETCQGAAACTAGKCVQECGPDSCAGCCSDTGECITSGSTSACGTGGAKCEACGSGRACEAGECIDTGCKASCASGCCTASGCQPGTVTSACGTGGNTCSVCGSGQTCTAKACTVTTTAVFDFIAVGATLPPTKLNGNGWDAFGGLPDPLVKVENSKGSGTTTYKSNTLKPVWNEGVLLSQTAAELKNEITITVTDSDTTFDDPVGGCKLTLKDSDFDGVLHTKSCPQTTTSVAFTFDYKVKAK